MVIKPRYESVELKILRCLKSRMTFSVKETQNYMNLEKGFEGELKFDKWLEEYFTCECLSLNDLLLESNNTLFQIDSMVLIQDTIYLFDVKNFEGDFSIENDRWYTLSKKELKDPLLQLKRSESLFRRLLQDLGFNTYIESYLIFVNPEFHLYQAPPNLPIIFPTQLKRFLSKLNRRPSKLKERHSKFAEQIVSLHLKESPYKRIPAYSYDQLEKGITCTSCRSLADLLDGKFVCKECGCKEDFTSSVLRSVGEYIILFPDRKITTNAIYDWCKVIKSKKTIRRILTTHFKLNGHGKSSYFDPTPFDGAD